MEDLRNPDRSISAVNKHVIPTGDRPLFLTSCLLLPCRLAAWLAAWLPRRGMLTSLARSKCDDGLKGCLPSHDLD